MSPSALSLLSKKLKVLWLPSNLSLGEAVYEIWKDIFIINETENFKVKQFKF